MTSELDRPDAIHQRGDRRAEAYDAQHDVAVPLEPLCRLVVDVLEAEGVAAGRVDLHLVDAITISRLNAEHMGHEGPTDVLSFPLDADPFDSIGGGPPMIGDIVVCPQIAAEQSTDHAGSVDAEFALLVVHGVLHLLGHDHAEPAETREMQLRERVHLAALGHSHPEQP